MKSKHYWIIGIVSFIFFLVTSAPASILAHFAKKYSGIELNNVQGTIWNGHAQSLHFSRNNFGQINWSISPWSLFLLKLNVQLHTRDPSGHSDLSLQFSMHHIQSDNIKAKFPARWIAPILKYPVNLDGDIFLRLINLEISDNKLTQIKGSIAWQNAFIQSPFGGAAKLGNLQLSLNNNQQNIEINVKDQGKPLAIDAKVLLSPLGEVNITGSVNANLPENINNFFNFFAEPARNGRRQFKYHGKLPG